MALSGNGGLLGSPKLHAQRSGFQEMMHLAAEFGSDPVIAVEGTGCYGAGLCRALQTARVEVVEVIRPDRSTRLGLDKDGSIDAESAARSFIAGKATGSE